MQIVCALDLLAAILHAQLGPAFLLSDEHIAWDWISKDAIGRYSLFASDKTAIQKFFARQ